MKPITPFLWFDHQAEEAARFYVSVFPQSRILRTTRYTEAGREQHGRPPGSVMTVEFELNGQHFTALNGGPIFQFNESVSFVVRCKDQKQIDRYWEVLTSGGGKEVQCGWLRDRFGLSWQVIPENLDELLSKPAAMEAMMKMKKLEIGALASAS